MTTQEKKLQTTEIIEWLQKCPIYSTEETLFREVKVHGNSGRIAIPKKYVGRQCKITFLREFDDNI